MRTFVPVIILLHFPNGMNTKTNSCSAVRRLIGIFKGFVRRNLSLSITIAAAVLLELLLGVMYFSAQSNIQDLAIKYFERETKVSSLRVSSYMWRAEVAVQNTSWVVHRNLHHPDSMFTLVTHLVKHSPVMSGAGIMFTPYYYPEKGRLYEPYAYRDKDGNIKQQQVASDKHDYLNREIYNVSITRDTVHWCEPYKDYFDSTRLSTTYSAPVYDDSDSIVAVIFADLAIDGLKTVIDFKNVYPSTRTFLFSKAGHLLVGDGTPFFGNVNEIKKNDKDNEDYVTMTDEKGERIYLFYHSVGGPAKWTLVKVCYERDILSKIRRVRTTLFLVVIASLLIMSILVIRTKRNQERFHAVNAEKARIDNELRVANEIQQSMLPHQHLNRDDVEIHGFLLPAREVGGDLYDYYISNDKLFFCIGDVSGKGAASAMLMAVISSMFRAFSAHENNPAHIMQSINGAICRNNEANMFATLFIGILDLPTGMLHYCSAGHDHPVMLSSEPHELECIPHLPVGTFDDVEYGVQQVRMEADTTLFLYTDGVTEARNALRRQFGLPRTIDALRECIAQHSHPEDIIHTVSSHLSQFVAGAPQSDDITMLAIRFAPQQSVTTLSESLTLTNDIAQVTLLSSFMKSVIDKLHIADFDARQLRLAVEEAVVNVMEYAYPQDTQGDVMLHVCSDGTNVQVTITDNGAPFDPTASREVDITLPVEQRQVGGLGILLLRKTLDHIHYERKNNQNILTLTKLINL